MNKLYKLIFTLFLIITCVFVNVKGVSAYEFAEDSYYIQLDESTLGEITVYVPADKVQFLSLQEDSTTIVNVSSGSFYGYFVANGNEYRVTFGTFEVPTYRLTSSGYTTYDLNVVKIIDTNIDFLENDSFISDSYVNQLIVYLLGFGVVVLCLTYLKR